MKHDLDARIAALAAATEIAHGRLEEEAVQRARAVAEKAGARMGLGLESTVVALAGPTGAGKSQLFNALTGTELASVGRRRPTTAVAQAAVWGDGGDALLDWLDVPRRHRLDADGLGGMVLLDLPDFDSIEAAHRLEADRIVALADLVLWVVEPQKYADASLHDRYLRPLASHASAMALVLNQADLLREGDRVAWRRDVERLLADDGLRNVPIAIVSARMGDGLPELSKLLRERVAAHDAAVERLAADVDAVVATLRPYCRATKARIDGADRKRLTAALEDAAGVPTALRAVADAHRRRGALATGWPFVRWALRLKPDPLRRFRLPESPQPQVRTSLPPATDVQRAQVASASRAVADGAAANLPPPWPRLVRAAAAREDDRIPERLDRAVAAADLHVSEPRWWAVARLLQRAFAFVAVLGAVWLAALAILGYLRIDDVVPTPELRGIAIPTWLLLGGVVAGIVFALLARALNRASAARRARAAAKSLRKRVDEVGLELVVSPVEEELAAHTRFCAALAAAAAT